MEFSIRFNVKTVMSLCDPIRGSEPLSYNFDFSVTNIGCRRNRTSCLEILLVSRLLNSITVE